MSILEIERVRGAMLGHLSCAGSCFSGDFNCSFSDWQNGKTLCCGFWIPLTAVEIRTFAIKIRCF